MEHNAQRPKENVMICAFEKLSTLRYPFCVKKWLYTSLYQNTMHNHEYPQIWYCLGGKYMHCVDGQSYNCKKGSVILVPPGLFHKFWVPENETVELMSLDINYDFFLEAAQGKFINSVTNLFLQPFEKELGLSISKYRMLCTESQRKMEYYMSWLITSELGGSANITKEEICAQLEAMFSLPEFAVSAEYRERAEKLVQARLNPVLRTVAYINMHVMEPITEEALLQISAMCRTDLYQNFKRFTGYSWLIYLQWLKTRRAFLYLTYTGYTLSYVSDVCGFYDVSHMSRIFKKRIGMTPKTFRIMQKQWLIDHPLSRRYLSEF